MATPSQSRIFYLPLLTFDGFWIAIVENFPDIGKDTRSTRVVVAVS